MGFAPQFTARIELRNHVTRLALSGELDMATVPVLEDHLAHFEGTEMAVEPESVSVLDRFTGSQARRAAQAAGADGDADV